MKWLMAIPVWSTPRDSLNRFNLVFSRCPYEESPFGGLSFLRTGRRCALTHRPQRPADLFSKGMFRASERSPAGRTHTCRRLWQVRDLIIAQTGGRPLLSACHVSGSEGRRRGDSLRNLFAPQLQSDERNSKNHWFLAAFFPPFLPLLEEMGPPEAQSREGGVEPRPYADVQNFIVSAAQRAAPTLAAAGGKCAI